MFHFCIVNCDAIRYGEYIPEATRAPPKAIPVAIISNIFFVLCVYVQCSCCVYSR